MNESSEVVSSVIEEPGELELAFLLGIELRKNLVFF